jgi:YegS/Rv2252/BmrU family lipid kinase
MKPKIIVIVNNHSRQAREASRTLAESFSKAKVAIEPLQIADKPDRLQKMIKNAAAKKPDIIVLAGGDGTVIRGIEQLSKVKYSGKIGILPLGTANYTARNLGSPLEIDGAIKRIKRGKSKSIPLGVSNDRFFALTFNLGLTQKISEEVPNRLKKRIGQAAYVFELFRQSQNHQAFEYKLTADTRDKPLRGKSHQLVIYNSDINQHLKLAPDHTLHKPTLRVLIYTTGNSILKLYISTLLYVLSVGRVRRNFTSFEASEIELEVKPNQPASYDGEVYSKGPYRISINKSAAKVIC